jgi:hypothetical protein
VSPYLDVYSVTIANISKNSISIPINIGSSKRTVKTLIDSGAGGLFIDQNCARNFDINYLDEPVKAYNMDGTENKRGIINAYVNLEFSLGEQKFKEQFYVTGLGKQRIILGSPWLHKYNPIIDWKKGEITFKPFEYLDIFSEEKAHCFPESRPWDHKIEMKEGFEPKLFKNYNLTPAEQIELDKFLKKNLEKGYIRPSQSPMASPFFFVCKKDGKLRPCQDYWYLNDWMVKNSYPLPLISEIMDKLKGTKYFTKLDVRWEYNNVQIRKGDEWKAAFKTNKGLFEPTMMFFGMCNSLATFQAIVTNNYFSSFLLL